MLAVLLRLTALGLLSTLLVLFWDAPLLKPLKLLVVFLHETSHALAAILTGGEVQSIAIAWDESGSMYARGGGIFFIVAIAGYTGSLIWGYLMLRASLTGRWVRTVSVIVGGTIIFFGFFPDSDISPSSGKLLKYAISGGWGFLLIFTAFLYPRLNHAVLFILGGLTALYALYDLNDFIRGDLMRTDAGILAHYLVGNSALTKPLAWLIAGFITALTLFIFVRVLRLAVRREEEAEAEPPPTEITPEMLEWLKRQSKKPE
ncbi:MAG: M50 family metallopeptidase [Turneriella sp.]|nr:M50 family metallopeptidase [Turneriella sp.]